MEEVHKSFKIQRIRRHRMYIDGNGINTLVGLYGCPLSCKYCLNKEILEMAKYEEITPEELVEKVLIDYCYFKATGGGVTFGGGEPLLYSGQIKAFRELLPSDIPIRVETSLNVPIERLKEVITVVDSYIIDIKTMNRQVYQDYTGLDNEYVLTNLQYLCDLKLQDKCKIRIPTIPNFTTNEEVDRSVEIIKIMGFKHLDIFEYVIR